MKKIILGLLLSLAALAAQAAGTVTNVPVTQIEATNSGVVVVFFSSIGTKPACATGIAGFALDATTAAGQALLKVIQEAYAMQVNVTAAGTGTCTIYTGYENLSYIYTNTSP